MFKQITLLAALALVVGCETGVRSPETTPESPDGSGDIVYSDSGYILESKRFIMDPALFEYAQDTISIENFNLWVTHLDQVYQAYAKLTGRYPSGGVKFHINVVDEGGFWAAAYVGGDKIIWNKACIADAFKDIERTGEWSFGMLHEIGHMFDDGGKWDADGECTASFKNFYAMETTGASVLWHGRLYTGPELRQDYVKASEDLYKSGEVFPAYNGGDASAYVLYLFGLVDRAGWEVYEKAFASYWSLDSIERTYYVWDDSGEFTKRNALARTFFDRIEKYAGKPVLNLLADEGALLETAFKSRKEERTKIRTSELEGLQCAEITLPSYITEIEQWGLARNKLLKTVVFPAQVVTFKNDIFNGCDNIKDVYIYAKDAALGEWMFWDSDNRQMCPATIHILKGGAVEDYFNGSKRRNELNVVRMD